MQLFSADAKLFFFKLLFFFDLKKLKNHPQNLLRNTRFFFSPVLPNGPKRRIPFQDVALRITVYSNGVRYL